jgi:hypothetical protein
MTFFYHVLRLIFVIYTPMDTYRDPLEMQADILGNESFMQQLCMATYTTPEAARESLIDYSLYVGEKDMYPIKRTQAHYGFHRWLRNQKRFNLADKKNDETPRKLVI